MNLQKALDDLNAERHWLETLIAALEVASRSPAHRLIWILDKNLTKPRSRGPSLYLSPYKRTELSRLARLVRGREKPTNVVEFKSMKRGKRVA